jgi:hypothetical protein
MMELLLMIETKNYSKVRECLLKDDIVSRTSLIFKDAKMFGGEGYLCYVSGTDDQCKKVLELTKDLAKEIKDRKKEEIINKIKEEEDKANIAFGGIFE